VGLEEGDTILLREGWSINRKRTRRIWRQEGLRRPVRARKRRRLSTARLRATKANDGMGCGFSVR
jgi:putative transposase